MSLHEGGLKYVTWRSTRCRQLASAGMKLCKDCQAVSVTLDLLTLNHLKKQGVPRTNLKHLTRIQLERRCKDEMAKKRAAQQRIAHQLEQIKTLELQTAALRNEIASISEETVFASYPNITDQEKLTVPTILSAAKRKSLHGMRYEVRWLLECMLLRIKCPSGYEHLRKTKLLPLPCRRTLARLLTGMSCHVGFNQECLNAIKMALDESKTDADRMLVLAFDEMTIQQAATFNCETLAFEGFIDLEDIPVQSNDVLERNDSSPANFIDDSEVNEHALIDEGKLGPKASENSSEDVRESLADHSLVFLCRSLTKSWIQPFGVFASKGAAPKEALLKLVIGAITRLDAIGATVTAVVHDGAQPNKGFWRLAGVEIKSSQGKEEVVNYFPHPCSDEKKVYVILDPPHLFKCIRNQMWNHQKVQADGKIIQPHLTIQRLYDHDNQAGRLRHCPKLRPMHIHPTSFQKMSVKLAIQVMSPTITVALQTYHTYENAQQIPAHKRAFTDALLVADLFKKLRDVFDILNGRCKKEAVWKTNWQTKTKPKLLEFDEYLRRTLKSSKLVNLKDVPMFISSVSITAARITLRTIIDLCDELFEKCNFTYVLTGKFNQDCLERFFGILRTSAGDDSKPTMSCFLQLFRMLSLYYSTDRLIKGSNIDAKEKMHVLQNYAELLRSRVKENSTKKGPFTYTSKTN